MRVLLLTHNHVVREFVGIASDKVEANLDIVDTISGVDIDSYDIFFVDDRDGLLSSSLELVAELSRCKSVLLYNTLADEHSSFDIEIKKPFLPSDIELVLHNIDNAHSLSYSEQILNPTDIDEIKALLDSDNLSNPTRETLADRIKKTKNKAIKDNNISVDESSIETQLLGALSNMERKKIKKLLSGAEVTISIKFPKERQ